MSTTTANAINSLRCYGQKQWLQQQKNIANIIVTVPKGDCLQRKQTATVTVIDEFYENLFEANITVRSEILFTIA